MIAFLLLSTLLAPLICLGACFYRPWREKALGLQALACAPALLAGLVGVFSTPGVAALGPARLILDRPGGLLLAGAALLWGLISWAQWRDNPPGARFGVSFLLTLIGSFWVFVADDLVSFYLAYALVSLPAYGLFAFSDDPDKKRAGAIYLGFALFGEALLLAAFAALAALSPDPGAGLSAQVAALAGAPGRDILFLLLVAGFGMKIGLLPFNGWMPLNYAAAPIPVAALLSGAGVKAGVIGLIRFLPLGEAWPSAGFWLGGLGFMTAFYGVIVGLTQKNPKAILAYSSISQMGVIAAALGLGLALGDGSAGPALAFYGFNHLLVKAALFLILGAAAAKTLPLSGAPLFLAAALALDLAGLPFSGGALAKLATKDFFGSGFWAALSIFSSIGSALLMTHFIGRLPAAPREAAKEIPAVLAQNWFALVLGALFLPWLFAPHPLEALDAAKIWEGFWPIAFGVTLGLSWRRIGAPAPALAPGDTIVVYEKLFARLIACGPALERLDGDLRRWTFAGAAVVAIMLALLVAV